MSGWTPVTPGPVGFAVGVLLVLFGGWLLWSRRRLRAEVVAEIVPAHGLVRVPQGYRHPALRRWHSEVPPSEARTELLARCTDSPDATVVMPRQQAAS